MTGTLSVDPADLHSVATGLQSSAADLQRAAPVAALSGAAGSMPALATGAACSRLADIVDRRSRSLARDMSQFAERLTLASAEYEARDTQLASTIHWAPESFREAPAESGDTPATSMSSGDINAIDAANRALLERMAQEYSRLPDGQVRIDRLADIATIREALTVPNSHLLYLEKPDNASAMIPAATAIGDPFTSDHVSVTVPGVSGATRHSIAGMTREAADLREEALQISGKVHAPTGNTTVSTIAWVGYQPPPTIVSRDTPIDDLAQAGAPKLEAFLRELDGASRNPDHTIALFGHSYGSLMSGIALKDGASAVVDNAVMYGSPGFEATSPAKLGMTDNNFFVMSAPDDWQIRGVGALAPLHGWGADPNEVVAGFPDRYRFTHLETDEGWVTLAGQDVYKTGSHGHSGYPQHALEQMTGFNLAAILLNRPDLAVREAAPE